MHKVVWVALTIFVWPLFSSNPSDAPARMLITLGHHYGQPPAALNREDLIVTQEEGPLAITNLLPLRGEHAGLELLVLIDSCSNCEPGAKFEELRHFIVSQPSTTDVGIAYMTGGRLRVAEAPTPDHERAVKALSTPAGGQPTNPYLALTELINGWPQSSSRHAVLMISTGIDPASPDPVDDPSVEAALEAAQRAGITVFAIYNPSADYLGIDSSKINSGQVQMAHLAYDTGGEAYFLSSDPLPSLAPFLTDIMDHLANQYLLEFLATPAEGTGELRRITVRSKLPEVELMAPDKVWITGRGTQKPAGSNASGKKRP